MKIKTVSDLIGECIDGDIEVLFRRGPQSILIRTSKYENEERHSFEYAVSVEQMRLANMDVIANALAYARDALIDAIRKRRERTNE